MKKFSSLIFIFALFILGGVILGGCGQQAPKPVTTVPTATAPLVATSTSVQLQEKVNTEIKPEIDRLKASLKNLNISTTSLNKLKSLSQ